MRKAESKQIKHAHREVLTPMTGTHMELVTGPRNHLRPLKAARESDFSAREPIEREQNLTSAREPREREREMKCAPERKERER